MTDKAKANRESPLRSIGPRTPEGKAVVVRNAVKQGLLSREALLPGEDRVAFHAMAPRLWEYMQPQ